MAHQITESDLVLLYKQKAWHGLGFVIEEEIGFVEAAKQGLLPNFYVEIRPAYFLDELDIAVQVPDRFIATRVDNTGTAGLGVVGRTYSPIQNDELWRFSDNMLGELNGHFETGGSLRGGRLIWGLIKTGEVEYLKGDPVEKYLLILNSHDGTSALRICMTDIRVVCNNTLQFALRSSINQIWIRHTEGRIVGVEEEIQRVFGIKKKWDEFMKETMGKLIQLPISTTKGKNLLEKLFTPPKLPKRMFRVQGSILVEDEDIEDEEETDRVMENRNKRVERILELYESGIGTDLQGVRGTSYGLLQAIIEYVDHERTFKESRRYNKNENRFQSILLPEGNGNKIKNKAFQMLLAA
jgi:phage/plasmid-like protein (TIGR03299 family)